MALTRVPKSLRAWFVFHFFADVAFALPLFFAPRWTLALLGVVTVDPLFTRIVAAALFGIGITSLLSAKESVETYRAMLTLKVIWSFAATLGILWSILEGYASAAWLAFCIFLVFHIVWLYYWWKLRQ
ncbi:MAG: hypothetical protein AABY13_02880 [Nanoarchaeota archaeon]